MDEKDCEYISEDSQQNHKDQIIRMVVKIENPDALEYLHTFVCLFLKKWG